MSCSLEYCPDRPITSVLLGGPCYDLIPINQDGSGYCQYWKDVESITIEYESNGDIIPYSLSNEHNEISYELMTSYPYIQFIYDSQIFIIGAKSQIIDSVYNEQFVWIGYDIKLNTSSPTPSPTPSDYTAPPTTKCCECTEITGNGQGCESDIICQEEICDERSECCDTFWDSECRSMAQVLCLPSPAPTFSPTHPFDLIDCTGDDVCYRDADRFCNGEYCEIRCIGHNACQYTEFYCSAGEDCKLICGSDDSTLNPDGLDSYDACKDVRIDATNAANLEIICADNAETCDEMFIHCPISPGSQCNIRNLSGYNVDSKMNNLCCSRSKWV